MTIDTPNAKPVSIRLISKRRDPDGWFSETWVLVDAEGHDLPEEFGSRSEAAWALPRRAPLRRCESRCTVARQITEGRS